MSNLINTQINPLAARFDLPQSEELYNVLKARSHPTISVYPPRCNAGLVFDKRTTRATADSAMATKIGLLQSSVGTLQADLTTEQTTRAAVDTAIASSMTTVQARLDTGNYAAVKVQSPANASAVTGLYAQYTVKLDVDGLISGFGLASGGPSASSQFGVRTDRFFLSAPTVSSATAPTVNVYVGMTYLNTVDGKVYHCTEYTEGVSVSWVWRSDVPDASTLTPFVVQTTPTTINGVAVPAGVFMRDAYIKNGTITNAKIANLAVDDAKVANLSVSKLTAGESNTGDITSTGTTVVGGVTLPSWTINCSTGLAVFNNVVVRGTVYATAGQIGGITIASDAVRAG